MFKTDDTIVAISTAAGQAARAIVRLSGPDAIRIAATIFAPAEGELAEMDGFRATDGLVRLRQPPVELPARAYMFHSPRSYTRQDVVELHVPGSPVIATSLVETILDAGARRAEAGEFTARAFFSGRIDLSRAEAVADVINSASVSQLRAAMGALGGRVHRLCEGAARRITGILAEIEASIDFAEDGLSLAGPARLAGGLRKIAAELRAAAEASADMPEAADRSRAVLAGAPNAGKSSLLNALSGTDRAMVSALAGTTRDVLGATMGLDDGMEVVLQDAAGLMAGDPADLAGEADSLTIEADSAALQAVRRADVLLLVADATKVRLDDENEDENPKNITTLLERLRNANESAEMLTVTSKIDLLTVTEVEKISRHLRKSTGLEVIATSAVRGDGLAELRRVLKDRLRLSLPRSGDAMGLHDRQRRCLLAAVEALQRAAGTMGEAAEIADVAELAAVDLRDSLAEIGAVSGQVVTEDVLGEIFSRFCVGK